MRENNAMDCLREETGLSFCQEHGEPEHAPQQDRPTVENLKHQVEAALLLDQVLVIIRINKEIKSNSLELMTVGNKIQVFLSSGLAENGWAWEASSSALAIAIRYVFSGVGCL